MGYKSYSQCITLQKLPANVSKSPVLSFLRPQRMSTSTFRNMRWSICSLLSAGWIICWWGSCRCAVPYACGTHTRYCCTQTIRMKTCQKRLYLSFMSMCLLSDHLSKVTWSGLGLSVLIRKSGHSSWITYMFEPTNFGYQSKTWTTSRGVHICAEN